MFTPHVDDPKRQGLGGLGRRVLTLITDAGFFAGKLQGDGADGNPAARVVVTNGLEGFFGGKPPGS